jgi:hypothetical protein
MASSSDPPTMRGLQGVRDGKPAQHRVRRARTLVGVRLQTAVDQAADRRIDTVHQQCRVRWRVLLSASCGPAFEHGLSGERFEQHQTETVQIAPGGGAMPRQLLGSHVSRCAAEAACGTSLGAAGDTEVGDAHLAPSVEHHVGRLEIAVQDAPGVDRGQTGTELPGDLHRLVARRTPDALQQTTEVFTVDVLHGQEVLAVDLTHVVDPADVGVRDLPGQLDLLEETLQQGGILLQPLGQELQRHALTQLHVVGAVDLPHAACPEPGHDAVAIGDDHARQEALALGLGGHLQQTDGTQTRGRGVGDDRPALGATEVRGGSGVVGHGATLVSG